MEKINWSNFDYNDFEHFCSILLTSEFGKKYVPFSAPGTDGGIDGQFEGTYDNYSGKWRFQFKFYQVARSTAINTLKNRLKTEITSILDEDFYVLVTNVEMLPQEQDELKTVAAAELSLINKSCKVFIWDGAKLNTLASQYPIIQFWLDFGFTSSDLREYKLEFEKNLIANKFAPDSFSNVFIGREDDLKSLEGFLHSDLPMALISGEAGIGKTRLAIHFFQKYVDHLDGWTALVLTAKSFEFDRIYKALFGGGNYIVLVDDAHNFEAKVIADLLSIAKQLPNVKLLLTSRTIEVHSALALIKETEKNSILLIEITTLSRSETDNFFRRYIKSGPFSQFINELIGISSGKPILMVAILQAISEGAPIEQIKRKDFFRSYVNNYFDAYCRKVQEITSVPILELRKLVKIIALIEPFDFNSKETIKLISEKSGINTENVRFALEQLKENSYVSGRYVQSIKPDYYSDILVADLEPGEAADMIFELIPFSTNIIVNLASAQHSLGEQSDVLTEVLKVFIDIIPMTSVPDAVRVIMTTILRISQIRPESAKYAIKVYTHSLKIPDHPSTMELEEDRKYNYVSGESIMGTAVNILKALYDLRENLDFVIRSAFQLYKITEDKRLVEIFSFNRKDIIDNFNMDRQNAFLENLSSRLHKLSDLELRFAVNVLRTFSVLDFHISQMSAANLAQLNITTYYLTEKNLGVVEFRSRMIKLLIQIFNDAPAPSILRTDVLKFLIDIPRSIFATKHNKVQYVNDDEINAILQLLLDKCGAFDLNEQKDILEKLHWFQRWGISHQLVPIIEQIKTALQPKNLVERLSYLFSNSERRIDEIKDIHDYVRQKSTGIIQQEKPDELSEALLEYLGQQQYPAHFFWDFVRTLEISFPEYCKVLYEKLYADHLERYGTLASRMLSALYFIHNDDKYYWEKIDQLRTLDKAHADNIILDGYASRIPGKTVIKQRDIDTIIEIFKKENPDNEHSLSMAIQLLFSVKHVNALDYAKQFLDRATQHGNVAMFFIRLHDNNEVSIEQLSELVLKHTERFQLTYEIERALTKSLAYPADDDVMDYFFRRFDRYIKEIQRTKSYNAYQFLPRGDYSRLSEEAGPEKVMELFSKAIGWYINTVDHKLRYFAKDLLSYLQPVPVINDELYLFYSNLLNNEEDPDHLIAIYSSLSTFKEKNESMIRLVTENFANINDLQYSDEESYRNVQSEAYVALTSAGVKTGTPGEPFAEDLALKELLLSQLSNLGNHDPAKKFLNEVLKSVQSEIDRNSEMEDSAW